jgi:NADH-quinone oxidoreductase subunit L
MDRSGAVGLAFLCAVVCFLWLQGQTVAARQANITGWHWVLAGNFRLDFGLLLDPLSSTMTLVITGSAF